MGANNLDYFTQIIHNSRAHPIFKKDWSRYDSYKFASTFLPYTNTYQGVGTSIFDGAELFKDIPRAEKQVLNLPNFKLVHSLVYTYPKGILAAQKKGIVQPAHNEICSFVEIDRFNTVEITLKIGSSFKKFLHQFYHHTGKSNINILDSKTYTMPVADFKAYFKNGNMHKNHMLYVFDLMNLSQKDILNFIAYQETFNTKFVSFLENLVIAGKYKVVVFIEKSKKDILYKIGTLHADTIKVIQPEKNEIYIWLVSEDYIHYEPTAEIQLGFNVAKDFIEKSVTKEDIQRLIVTQIQEEIAQNVLKDTYVDVKITRALSHAMIAYTLQEQFKKDPLAKEVFESSPTAYLAVKAAEFTAESVKHYRIPEKRWNPHAQGFNPLFKGNTIHNAYYCGVINGLIDLVAGTPEMVAFLSKIFHSKTFAAEFFGSIKKLIDEEKVIEAILEALSKDYKNAKSPEALFYHMSVDIVNLISILIGLYGTAVSIQNFVKFTRKGLAYFRVHGRKGFEKFKRFSATKKKQVFDEFDEVRLAVKEQYARFRETKRYNTIKEKWIDEGQSMSKNGKIPRYRDHEALSAVHFEEKFKVNVRASKISQGETGDFMILSGPYKGKSIDMCGTPRHGIIKQNRFSDPDTKAIPIFKKAIKKHFEKIDEKGLDYVVIDFNNFDDMAKTEFMHYINTNWKHKRNHLLILNE